MQDRRDNTRSQADIQGRKDIPGDEGADDPDDDIADQSEAEAFDDQPSQPATAPINRKIRMLSRVILGLLPFAQRPG